MNKIIYPTFFFLLFSIFTFGQKNIQKDTIYLDENRIEITKPIFNKKTSAAVFYSRSYETKDMVIYKVVYKFYFGKINFQENKQIRLLLNRHSNNVQNNENILIKYFDTLYDYSSSKNSNKKHFLKYHTKIIIQDTIAMKFEPYTTKIYNSDREKTQKKLKKCSKTLSNKKNTKAFYIYHFDQGFPFLIDESLIWLKDNGTFKNTFFKISDENNLLIIKPNGDYFLKFGHFSDSNLFNLLKKDDWNSFFIDWERSIKTNSKKGIGIIKEFTKEYGHHIKHCY